MPIIETIQLFRGSDGAGLGQFDEAPTGAYSGIVAGATADIKSWVFAEAPVTAVLEVAIMAKQNLGTGWGHCHKKAIISLTSIGGGATVRGIVEVSPSVISPELIGLGLTVVASGDGFICRAIGATSVNVNVVMQIRLWRVEGLPF